MRDTLLQRARRQPAATHLLVATLLFLGILLGGCGGGSKPDNQYQGTYRSAYSIPGLNQTGTFTYTVGQKGGMTGSFTDSSTNTSMAFNGQLENNGAFSGQMVSTGKSYDVSGTFGSGGASGGGGDFRVTISGVQYTGNFVVGGTPTTVTSDFQGYYNGVYTVPGLTLNGNNSFTVDSTGKITGLFTRGQETALLTGTVNNTGAFDGSVTFSDGILNLSGTLSKSTNNTSIGNFTAIQAGKGYAGTFGPTTVQQGDSPYRGAYRGTYGMPELGENGNVSFTVTPDGSLTGFFSQTQNKPVGTLTGAFNNDGTFSGNVTYPAGSPAPYNVVRSITGKVATSQVSGSVGVAGDFTMTINGVKVAGNMQLTAGGSEPDSIYRTAYSDGGYLNGSLNGYAFHSTQAPTNTIVSVSPTTNISVDKEGSFIGNFGPHDISGRITNDGRIIGSFKGLDGRQYAMRGIISKVVYTLTIGFDKDNVAIFKDKPGINVDLLVTLSDGTEYSVNAQSLGGDGKT